MKFIDTVLDIGVEAPFELLHFSDIHLALADERDDLRKRELAAKRRPHFAAAEENLAQTAAEARRTGALLVSTGDLIDFVSHANLDAVRRFTDENDCFFAAGNHEFSLYVGEAFEDAEYRNRSLARVQSAFRNDIRFASRIVNGVNLVAVDNSYYLFEPAQLDALKAECRKGLPVILLMHVPLYTEALCRAVMETYRQPCSYLMAAPDAVVDAYESDYRRRQQRADAVTREAFEYILSEPAIRAVLAGHLHEANIEDPVADRLTQYIVDTQTARRILVK